MGPMNISTLLGLVTFSLLGTTTCLGQKGGGQSGPAWTPYDDPGPFTISVPAVTLGTTDSKTFELEVTDWDLWISDTNLQASMKNTRDSHSGTWTFSNPGTLSCQFQTVLELTLNRTYIRYKWVSIGATAGVYSFTWTATDEQGYNWTDNSTTEVQLVTVQ